MQGICVADVYAMPLVKAVGDRLLDPCRHVHAMGLDSDSPNRCPSGASQS